MDPNLILRLATTNDAAAIAEIYAYYVTGSTASFEYQPPGEQDFIGRISNIIDSYPCLVCQDSNSLIIGYAYGGPLGTRAGYGWTATVSVYIRASHHRAGVGRALYAALERLLTAQGYRSVYALISSPNPASEAFHKTMGYHCEGILRDVGYKFGKPLSVCYYCKRLLPVVQNPPLPRPFSALGLAEVEAGLAP